jgi:hypothetical protein
MNSYLRNMADQLHAELGHDLDGALTHEDRVYNSIQCLCFWSLHGDLDKHTGWSPDSPAKAVTEVMKAVRKLPAKEKAVTCLNKLTTGANMQRPDLKPGKLYAVDTSTTDTGHEVQKIRVAPAIVTETTKPVVKDKKPKQLAEKKASKTVVATI